MMARRKGKEGGEKESVIKRRTTWSDLKTTCLDPSHGKKQSDNANGRMHILGTLQKDILLFAGNKCNHFIKIEYLRENTMFEQAHSLSKADIFYP